MQFFFYIIASVFISVHFISCASKGLEELAGCNKFWSGWAGNYADYRSIPFDYFYNVWDEEINLKELAKTKTPEILCKENSIKNGSDALIGKMIGESIQGTLQVKNETEEEKIGIILVKKYQKEKDKIQIKECRPLYPPNPKLPYSEWRECRCILYLHVPGGQNKIIQEAQELQKMNL